MKRATWGFYGREEELDGIAHIMERNRWFFLKISGRRRIGKTTLIQQAIEKAGRRDVVYLQIPDSDPAGVVSSARDFFEMFGVSKPMPTDLRSLAGAVGELSRRGFIVAIDEFQYFNRKVLYPFMSQLQAEVDQLAAEAEEVPGGLIVLGSLHAEMAALLDDRSAPLFNRVTDSIELGHLDVASVLEILRTHADDSPERLLFLWSLFEGVPKFYRDCHEREALGEDRQTVLKKLFFSSSSPLRTEADSWFLRELRGRYDLVLKYVARHPGCTNADILEHVKSVEPSSEKQVGGYLKILDERFRMVERLQPVMSKPRSRSGRFYLRDNFLRSWLSSLSTPVSAMNFRPLQDLVDEADQRLRTAEGHGLERLVAAIYEERSRKSVGDFSLTRRVQGYWDRGGTEIDLVAIDEEGMKIRFGTCKRSAGHLFGDLGRFDGHVERFMKAFPRYRSWNIEKVAVATSHDPGTRRAVESRGYLAEDLRDLTAGL